MEFGKALLDWYYKNRRILPWREDPTPYHVYLSETMLQQTQVKKVLPYYERFLKRYPTLADLASATEEDVLILWQGLGYYSRARNLLKGSCVLNTYNSFPSDETTLRKIPGIGSYSEKAIRAIAFHQKAVSVDGNLIRVFKRLESIEAKPSPELQKRAEAFFMERLSDYDPSAFNQALMDLGEMVCLPNGMPLCEKCPFQSFCKTNLSGGPLPPVKKGSPKKAKKPTASYDLFLFYSDHCLQIRKRPANGLLANLYEFPMRERASSARTKISTSEDSHHSIIPLDPYKHVFSHLVWEIHPIILTGSSEPFEGCFPARLEEIGSKYPLPTAFRKAFDLFLKRFGNKPL